MGITPPSTAEFMKNAKRIIDNHENQELKDFKASIMKIIDNLSLEDGTALTNIEDLCKPEKEYRSYTGKELLGLKSMWIKHKTRGIHYQIHTVNPRDAKVIVGSIWISSDNLCRYHTHLSGGPLGVEVNDD